MGGRAAMRGDPLAVITERVGRRYETWKVLGVYRSTYTDAGDVDIHRDNARSWHSERLPSNRKAKRKFVGRAELVCLQ
jgi:hypothetical protein